MKLSLDQVNIRVYAETEDISVKEAARDCAPGFEEAVRAQRRKSRTWGWCTVHIIACLKKGPVHIEGDSYLGCCSYSSKQDFIENSGYYDQMVEDAIADLQPQIQTYYENLAEDLESLATGKNDDFGRTLIAAANTIKSIITAA